MTITLSIFRERGPRAMQRALQATARRTAARVGGRRGERSGREQAAASDGRGWRGRCRGGGGAGGGGNDVRQAAFMFDAREERVEGRPAHVHGDNVRLQLSGPMCRRSDGIPSCGSRKQQQADATAPSTPPKRTAGGGSSSKHHRGCHASGPLAKQRQQQQQQQQQQQHQQHDVGRRCASHTLQWTDDSPRWQAAPMRWWSALVGRAQHRAKQGTQFACATQPRPTMRSLVQKAGALSGTRMASSVRRLHTDGQASPLYEEDDDRSGEGLSSHRRDHHHDHHDHHDHDVYHNHSHSHPRRRSSGDDGFRDGQSGQHTARRYGRDRHSQARSSKGTARQRGIKGVGSSSNRGSSSSGSRCGDDDREWMASAGFAAQSENDSLFAQLPRQRWLQQADPLVLAQRMRSSHTVMLDVTKKVMAALEANDVTAADACHMINLLGQAGRARLALRVWHHIAAQYQDQALIHPELYTVTLRACALSGLVAEAERVFEGMLAHVGKLLPEHQRNSSSSNSSSSSSRSITTTDSAGMGGGASLGSTEASHGSRATASSAYAGGGGGSGSGSWWGHGVGGGGVSEHSHEGEAAENGYGLSLYAPSFAAMQLVFAMQGDVQRTYSVVRLMMARYRLPPHRSHRLHLLLAHARGGDVVGAEACYSDVVAPYVSGDDRAHRYLLEAYATTGDVDGAERVFSEMSTACRTVDARALTSLVKAYRIAGNAQGATATLQRVVRDFALTPPTKAFTTAIRAHAEAGDVRGAEDALRMMKQCGVAPDVSAFEFLIHAHLNRGDRARAMEVYTHVFTRQSPLRPTPLIHTALLSHHMAAGDAAAAAAVLLRCQLHGHNVARSLPQAEAWGVVEEATRALAHHGAGADGVQGDGEGQQTGAASTQAEAVEMEEPDKHRPSRVGPRDGNCTAQTGQSTSLSDSAALEDHEAHGGNGPSQHVAQQRSSQQQRHVSEEERQQVMMMMRNHAWHRQSGHPTHDHHHRHSHDHAFDASSKGGGSATADADSSPSTRSSSSSSSSSSMSSRTWCEFCGQSVLPIRFSLSPSQPSGTQ